MVIALQLTKKVLLGISIPCPFGQQINEVDNSNIVIFYSYTKCEYIINNHWLLASKFIVLSIYKLMQYACVANQ
jgi:hypothetical protein